MIDIEGLLGALPVSGLEPQRLAIVTIPPACRVRHDGGARPPRGAGSSLPDRFPLLEPPARDHVPYVEPIAALRVILQACGQPKELALRRALQIAADLLVASAPSERVVYFNDLDAEPPTCVALPALIGLLRKMADIEPGLPAFLAQASDALTHLPLFSGRDGERWSLQGLSDDRPPKAQIEFVPSAPWDSGALAANDGPYLVWRESMREHAWRLAGALGEPVFHFADLDADDDDDAVHRLLVLHWCCTHRPDSPFVRQLLRAAGTPSVELLRTALLDPASYRRPFRMNDAFVGVEAQTCALRYRPPGTRRNVGIVFLTAQAHVAAASLLPRQIDADVTLVAPAELVDDAWLRQAARYCARTRVLDPAVLARPQALLSAVDELLVVANEKTAPRSDALALDDAVLDLLWQIGQNGQRGQKGPDVHCFSVDGWSLPTPEPVLPSDGAGQRTVTSSSASTGS